MKAKAELSEEKTIISHLRNGFSFLGAHIRKHSNHIYKVKSIDKHGNLVSRRVPLKLFITAPIGKIIDKLIKNNFAHKNHLGNVFANGLTRMYLNDHYTIISYYNSIINGLLNFFSFAGNFSSLHRVL